MQPGTLLRAQKSQAAHSYLFRPPAKNFPFRVEAPTLNAALAAPLPTTVDLRQYCRPIWPDGQGTTPACTGFASAAFREVIHAVATGTVLNDYLSPMYIYAYSLLDQGQFGNTTAGSSIAEEFYVLTNHGDCPYTAYTKDDLTQGHAPTAADDVSAYPFRLTGSGVVDYGTRDSVKQILASRQPIAISFAVYLSFEQTGRNGIVPAVDTANEPFMGAHAVLVVGYNDTPGYWIVRNSWGITWGDAGYCYMPYGYEGSTWLEAWSAPPQP